MHVCFSVIIPDEEVPDNNVHIPDSLALANSIDSIPSAFTNGSCSPSSKIIFYIYLIGLLLKQKPVLQFFFCNIFCFITTD